MSTRKSVSDEITLSEAVDRAVTGAGKFSQKDMAAITLARQYAKQIDGVIADPESSPGDRVKAMHLAPHLLATLRALGLTPEGREELALIQAKARAAQKGNDPAPKNPRQSMHEEMMASLRAV